MEYVWTNFKKDMIFDRFRVGLELGFRQFVLCSVIFVGGLDNIIDRILVVNLLDYINLTKTFFKLNFPNEKRKNYIRKSSN